MDINDMKTIYADVATVDTERAKLLKRLSALAAENLEIQARLNELATQRAGHIETAILAMGDIIESLGDVNPSPVDKTVK